MEQDELGKRREQQKKEKYVEHFLDFHDPVSDKTGYLADLMILYFLDKEKYTTRDYNSAKKEMLYILDLNQEEFKKYLDKYRINDPTKNSSELFGCDSEDLEFFIDYLHNIYNTYHSIGTETKDVTFEVEIENMGLDISNKEEEYIYKFLKAFPMLLQHSHEICRGLYDKTASKEVKGKKIKEYLLNFLELDNDVFYNLLKQLYVPLSNKKYMDVDPVMYQEYLIEVKDLYETYHKIGDPTNLEYNEYLINTKDERTSQEILSGEKNPDSIQNDNKNNIIQFPKKDDE